MDYQSHYYTFMPALATLYAVALVGRSLRVAWSDALLNQDKDRAKFVKSLGDFHSTSAGMKAWVGWWGAEALEAVRRCMGGHGYSAYSAIPGLIADYAVMTQGGGDNCVLAQQVIFSTFHASGFLMPLHIDIEIPSQCFAKSNEWEANKRISAISCRCT